MGLTRLLASKYHVSLSQNSQSMMNKTILALPWKKPQWMHQRQHLPSNTISQCCLANLSLGRILTGPAGGMIEGWYPYNSRVVRGGLSQEADF